MAMYPRKLHLPARVDLLEAYVSTYLAREIRAEALVRNLESFTRFLEVAVRAGVRNSTRRWMTRGAPER
jgi:hypothetical protein